MITTSNIVRLLAALPAAAAAASKPFDIKDLSLREVGARNTLEWRVWLEQDGEPISFWHDIPLYPDPEDKSIIHYYTEIPRWTDGKIETKRDEPLNPIFHDEKNDLPRFVYSVWPHKTYPFNYGSIPQTWEDKNQDHPFTGYPGDNDPVDIFDISELPPSYIGQVKKVKVLGALAMIDDEATDWKVIAIDVEDPVASKIDSVEDLDKYRPGVRQQMYDWFVYYKVVKGDGTNTILGEEYQNATFAQQVLSESHDYWLNLMKGKSEPGKIVRNQTSNARFCSTYIPKEDTTEAFKLPSESEILPAAEKPEEYNRWYYLDPENNWEQIQV